MSIDTNFIVELRKRIEEESARCDATLIGGNVKDFSEYRYALGYKKALSDITIITDEILTTIQQG